MRMSCPAPCRSVNAYARGPQMGAARATTGKCLHCKRVNVIHSKAARDAPLQVQFNGISALICRAERQIRGVLPAGSAKCGFQVRIWSDWSGRRGSNPRPRPWQGRALPLSYTRIRDGGDWSPTTAHLCQMRTVNATLLRTVKFRPGTGRFIAKWSPNTRNQPFRRFPAIEKDRGRRQLGQIDPTLNRAQPC
jgi:hypothetical protein